MNSFKLLINFIETCKLHSGNGRYIAAEIDNNATFIDIATTTEVKIIDDGITIKHPAMAYLHIGWEQFPEKYKRELVELLTEEEFDKELERKLRSFFT